MEDSDLKQLLDSIEIPTPDNERRKEVLNLAQMEFEKTQKNNNKNYQGSSFLSRLITRHSNRERDKMTFSQRKAIYGGMATACVALLIYTAYPLVQQNRLEKIQSVDASKVNKITYGTNDETSVPTLSSVLGLDESNKHPIQPPAGLDLPTAGTSQALNRHAPQTKSMDPNAPKVDPLLRWREMQDERLANKASSDAAGIAAPMADRVATSAVAASPPMGGASFNSIIAEPMPYQPQQEAGRDKFKDFEQNAVHQVANDPMSTLSIDVDTASYAFVRQNLDNGVLPQSDAVRVEELVNYFDYAYPVPDDKSQPFKAFVAVQNSPWHEGRKLVTIGIKGYEAPKTQNPDSNLVFLIDTSGSMNEQKKLPLLKQSLAMLVDQLKPTDKVSIVVYAGSAGTVLPPTAAADKQTILMAIQNLQSGGATAGAEGINLAYQLAESSFNKNAVNRVILATDGDFNVGITNPEELKSFIEKKRNSGVFLSVLGFGQGNYNDALMQDLAQNGNGVAAYIDSLNEARKVLVQEAGATLFPIAKDVKIQMEFNPKTVSEYRLVGYETRALATEDFNNDKVDAGDIGSGHEVTAIYEITPVGGPKTIDDSRYAAKTSSAPAVAERNDLEYGFLKIRYKLPEESVSKLITTPITPALEDVPPQLKSETDFATAVAGFGQLLKGGKYTGSLTYDDIIKAAEANKGADPFGYRSEFINLVYKAKTAAAMQPVNPGGYNPNLPQ